MFIMKISNFICRYLLAAIAGVHLQVTAQVRQDLLGESAPAAAATRTIAIEPTTRWVNVTGGEIILFTVGDRSFAWSFSVPTNVSSFSLNRIAPPGLLAREVIAYVAPDPRYIGGDGWE